MNKTLTKQTYEQNGETYSENKNSDIQSKANFTASSTGCLNRFGIRPLARASSFSHSYIENQNPGSTHYSNYRTYSTSRF